MRFRVPLKRLAHSSESGQASRNARNNPSTAAMRMGLAISLDQQGQHVEAEAMHSS
jgi:Flp pilus assembly protein TadD